MKISNGRNVTDKPLASKQEISPKNSASIQKLHVGREIAETTWRMTIPVVFFTFIGIFIDLRFGARPWMTFLGVIIGFYFAVVLIKKQIERSKDLH